MVKQRSREATNICDQFVAEMRQRRRRLRQLLLMVAREADRHALKQVASKTKCKRSAIAA